MIDIAEILTRKWPGKKWVHRGEPDDLAGLEWLDAGRKPTRRQIEKAAAEVEAEKIKAASLVAARGALRAQWDALPAKFRGPYRGVFRDVVELLDEGDKEAALEAIRKLDPRAGYSGQERAEWEQIRSTFESGIENLPTMSQMP